VRIVEDSLQSMELEMIIKKEALALDFDKKVALAEVK